jgi:Subtilase family/Secretion system C-terminal sorting domain
MKKIYLPPLLTILFISPSFGQHSPNAYLKEIADYKSYLRAQDEKRIALIQEYKKSHIKPFKHDNLYIHHIDLKGQPVYYKSYSNLILATSIKANKLWSGGGMGLSLSGAGMEVSASRSRLGIWEPGPGRWSHQEFAGRAILRDLPAFSAHDGNTSHATHVGATMIGAGIVDSIKGGSFGAKMDCYEVQTSEKEEMLTAASEGMLVSNHSYGPAYDTTLTLQGMYESECVTYDSIQYLNKYYLPVFAAGNDRDEANNRIYDIVSGGACAKNGIAVGAVEKLYVPYANAASVIATAFTCYGPMDDSRIKPDFVAPGMDIYSANSQSDADYNSQSGTSMAAPGSAAALFLLQQHHKNIKAGAFMKSATLKALAIHTCDEAGTGDGPDAKFGFGLLNMESAINVLNLKDNEHYYEEASLANGATYSKNVVAKGGPMKVTIAWTDKPGIATAAGVKNDRTAKLIHDLDLRIYDLATNTVIAELPWKLDALNPTANATRGDNTVDNVEQILTGVLTANKGYTIKVTHKGTLTATQEFSLMVSGLGAAVTGGVRSTSSLQSVFYPNPILGDRAFVSIEGSTFTGSGVIIDQLGKVVYSFQAKNQRELELDLVKLDKGIYYLNLIQENQEPITHKFVK